MRPERCSRGDDRAARAACALASFVLAVAGVMAAGWIIEQVTLRKTIRQ